jgi:hypothetical protein
MLVVNRGARRENHVSELPNRTETNGAFTVNEALRPEADLNNPRRDPVVAVVGYRGRVAGLPAHLPSGWSVRPVTGVLDVLPDEIVLFSGAKAGEVAAARAVLPKRTRIVALVDEDAPAESVAAVLTAGADACVRAGQPAILAGHLVACRRRQLSERWLNMETPAT